MKSRNPLLIGLLTLMAWLWAMPSLSQGVAFGVKGGIDVMKMEFDDDVFDDSNRGGWFVGPTVVFSVPVPGFSIDLSALYDERTLKVEGEKLEQKSVIIPANARIGASLGFGSVYLCGGPQLAFNVGASSYRWEDVKNEVKLAGHWNGDLGYPASVQLPDGTILTVYYQAEFKGEKTCLMGTLWRVTK